MAWETFNFKGGTTRSGRKIGEILEGDKFVCALCSGKGILPRTKGIKCPACRGAGIISLTGPAMVCAFCKGRGDYPPRTNLTCTVCKGAGVVSITKPIEVCRHCRGNGRARGEQLPCLKCRGKGVVVAKQGTAQPVQKASALDDLGT